MPSADGPIAVSKDHLKIVIVGGVAGGMSAATRARRLSESASITVLERGPFVSYANCGIPYALGGVIANDEALILQTPKAFKDRFNVDVYIHTEVVSIDREKRMVGVRTAGTEEVRQIPYDKLILSQGAEPFRPPMLGVSQPNVFTLQTIPDLEAIKSYLKEHSAKSVCIIGGGFIGLEAAENLALLDLNISILEYAPHVFPPIDQDISERIHTELRKHKIDLRLNARISKIDGNSVVLENGSSVPADIILMNTGIRARKALAESAGLACGKTGVTVNSYMQTNDPDIYAVGDMTETSHRIAERSLNLALAGPANRQGRLAADHIFSRAPEGGYKGNVGTSVCKVFDVTIASVGLSVATLKAIGKDPEYVSVHPPDHAGYYPGAHPVSLKVAFCKKTGKLLGAQAVGISGVEKRIDVLATAMQAGMTIFDLEHLELAYAPPYGSAKDPVNMAGFVGSNILRGDSAIIHPDDVTANPSILQDYQVVDVRSPGEFSRGHLPDAVNLPINDLRGLITKLDTGKKVLVYCQVGYRGYLGYRILKQAGFDVVNLDGGYKSVSDGSFKSLMAFD